MTYDIEKPKIILISGAGRSGSTILGNVLGSLKNIQHIGEFQRLWERGLIENGTCGCGAKIRECLYWKNAIGEYFLSPPSKINEYVSLDRKLIKTRSIFDKLFNNQSYEKNATIYLRLIENCFESIFATNPELAAIVDGSKYPTYAEILKKSKKFDVYIIHLVRDPRAVAYSWGRTKYDPDRGSDFAKMNPVKSAIVSLVWNWLIAFFNKNYSKYMLLKYEDLVRNPCHEFERIAGFSRISEIAGLANSSKEVTQSESHTIAGNPGRFGNRKTVLKPDDEWEKSMPIKTRAVVTLLSIPTLFKYRYPL